MGCRSTPAQSVDTKAKPQDTRVGRSLSPDSGRRVWACTFGGRRDAGCRVLRSLWSPGSQFRWRTPGSEHGDQSDRSPHGPRAHLHPRYEDKRQLVL